MELIHKSFEIYGYDFDVEWEKESETSYLFRATDVREKLVVDIHLVNKDGAWNAIRDYHPRFGTDGTNTMHMFRVYIALINDIINCHELWLAK